MGDIGEVTWWLIANSWLLFVIFLALAPSRWTRWYWRRYW